jgi:hypothetical protein
MIKIDFEIKGFRDALILADDHGLTDAEIEALKQARYDKWYAHITSPSVAVEETVAADLDQE